MDINQIHVNPDSKVLCRIQGLNEMVRYEFWVVFFRGKEMVPFERYEKSDDLSFGFCFWGKERYEKRVFHFIYRVFFKGKLHFVHTSGLLEKYFSYL